MDSTRTSRARASRGATTRRARFVYISSCAPAVLASQGVPLPQVSLALLAKDLGATPARSGSVTSMSRLSASIAKRGSRLVPTISRRSSATTTTAGDGSRGEATVSVDSVGAAVSAEAAQEHV